MSEGPFRCGLAARWLPRVLAASILMAATLAALRLDLQSDLAFLGHVRNFLILAGALLSLWLVRNGAEVRSAVAVDDDGLTFSHGRRRMHLRFKEMVRLGYAAPFAATRNWLPAMLIHDRDRQSWRVPALTANGDRLLALILEKAGRNDLETWAETIGLARRMAGFGRRIAIGYTLAGAVLLAGLLYYYH